MSHFDMAIIAESCRNNRCGPWCHAGNVKVYLHRQGSKLRKDGRWAFGSCRQGSTRLRENTYAFNKNNVTGYFLQSVGYAWLQKLMGLFVFFDALFVLFAFNYHLLQNRLQVIITSPVFRIHSACEMSGCDVRCFL